MLTCPSGTCGNSGRWKSERFSQSVADATRAGPEAQQEVLQTLLLGAMAESGNSVDDELREHGLDPAGAGNRHAGDFAAYVFAHHGDFLAAAIGNLLIQSPDDQVLEMLGRPVRDGIQAQLHARAQSGKTP